MAVIQERGLACGVSLRHGVRGYKVLDADGEGHLQVTFETEQDIYSNVRLGLCGRHQAVNAGVAIGLAEALREQGFKITRAQIIKGIESARHEGRLEWRDSSPRILFDGAHNAAGASALRDYLQEFVHAPITLIFGAMRDKDLADIASKIFPLALHIIFTQPDNPRAAAPEMLARLVSSNLNSVEVTIAPDVRKALQVAHEQTPPDGIICITGSLYLVGEAQKFLQDEAAHALPQAS
jgi:dihydrofolate synthase/folylpolyglutamate synthase